MDTADGTGTGIKVERHMPIISQLEREVYFHLMDYLERECVLCPLDVQMVYIDDYNGAYWQLCVFDRNLADYNHIFYIRVHDGVISVRYSRAHLLGPNFPLAQPNSFDAVQQVMLSLIQDHFKG